MKSSSFKTHFQMIREFVKNNKIIFCLWSIVLVALFGVMDFNISQKIEGFASIETVDVNFNQNVTVRNIYKSVGETVKAGSLLLTLENKELSIEIARKNTEIESLEKKLKQAQSIDANEIINILKADLKILKDEIAILHNKEEQLSVYADYDCIISDIYFSKGEYIPAYTDIMSVQKKETTLVNAFINEYENKDYKPGQLVMVENLDRSQIVEGEIILASNDISMAPERLNNLQMNNQWGQKLVIKLKKPVFKRGEKLLIQLINHKKGNSFFSTAKAEIDDDIKLVTILKSKKELSEIKALSDKLFLVSDDEGKKISDSLFIYNLEQNKIQNIDIDDDKDIEDVESIIVDNNYIIAIASHSETRDGNDKNDRNKIIILEKNNDHSFQYKNTLELKDILKAKLKKLDDKLELEIEAADATRDEYIFALKESINHKYIFIRIQKNDLHQNYFENIKISQLQAPIKGLGLSAMKIRGDQVLLTLNEDEESFIFQTNTSFNDTQLLTTIHEKVEGIEVYEDYYLLSVDKNKKSGKILRHKYVK